jgi:hypothetical protein
VLAAAIITAAATVGLAVLAYCQISAGRTQTSAALKIARETREAAQRQWQPRVFVHAWANPVPGTGDNAAPDEMAVPYRLENEGTGPAFNVAHGVEVAGKLHTWGDRQYRSIRAGQELPPMLDSIGMAVKVDPLVVGVKLTEWNDGEGLVYWSRFENLLGERFEVRNYPDPTRPAEFRRIG